MSGSLILSPGWDVDTAAIEFESHSKSPFRSACLIPIAGLEGDIILFRRSMSESSSIPNEKTAACRALFSLSDPACCFGYFLRPCHALGIRR